MRWYRPLALSHAATGALTAAGLLGVSAATASLPGPTVALLASTALGTACGLVAAYVLASPLRRLATGLWRLAAADPADASWHQRLGSTSLQMLTAPLEELRGSVSLRIAALETQTSQLQAIVDGVGAGILVSDRAGRVLLANGAVARILRVPEPLHGRLLLEVVRSQAVDEAVARTLSGAGSSAAALCLNGGSRTHVDVHVAPLYQGGDLVGAVATLHDTTHVHRLERTRKDFVANVSHELRTPLTAIRGYAETLRDGALGDRSAAEGFVQVIAENADRLSRLLDDILDLSRLESESFQVRPEVTGLRTLVESAAAPVGHLARSKQVTLHVDIPDSLQVMCEPRLVEQALVNLLDNAVKYTPEGGSVHVRCLPTALAADGSPLVTVQVADTGIGIPSTDVERVFERFYRVDKGRSRAMGGTGLGLAIVRHILQAHGQRVWVESELGRGSTFSFTLTCPPR